MRWVLHTALVLILMPAMLQANPKKPRPFRPNVVLITIDTLRADHLSSYGYRLRTSPHIDQLAGEGTLFQNAYCPIPLTGPSHISLMTSLFPQEHGATINGMHMSTKPRPIMLAQILHRLGYKTAAFVSAWPLKRKMTGLGRGFGVYNQKFTYRYKLVNAARTAPEVGTAARRWIKRHAHSTFFLWLHYFDPHEPYVLHPEFAHLSPAGGASHAPAWAVSAPSPEMGQRIQAYDSEIAFADRDLGETLGLLEELGLKDRTLIVLAADHGESLGENDYVGHGDHIYQEIVHVPLIMSYGNVIPRGKTLAENVSLVDVMPTILDYVGIRVKLAVEGSSLKPTIEASGPPPPERRVYFLTYREPPLLPPNWISWIWTWAKRKMTPAEVGFVQGHLKVVSVGGEPPGIYDLQDGFSQEIPLAPDDIRAAQAQNYHSRLAAWFDRTNRGLTPQGQLSEQDVEMLKSLGYVNP
jgi:arylsulfatase A-like enzyme